MQNLDQIRAAAALEAADNTSKQAVSKLPALILQNGLLAAAAFATEDKPPRKKMGAAMNAIASHLSQRIPHLANQTTAAKMINTLSSTAATPHDLQRATSEALAFLAFLKRFTTKEENPS